MAQDACGDSRLTSTGLAVSPTFASEWNGKGCVRRMITEQQVITQMKQVMSQIEQSSGETQKRHLAKLMGYCELLLADSAPAKTQPTTAPMAEPVESKPPLDRQMAAFLGIPLEEEDKPKTDSLLDF